MQYATGLISAQGGWAKFKSFRDTWDFFGDKNEFNRSQVGAFPIESWYLNTLVQTGAGARLTGIPFTDRDGQPISWETGSAWAIPKGTDNPLVAIRFAQIMTATETWMKAAAARQQTDDKSKQPNTGLFTANTAADKQIRDQYVKATGQAGVDHAITAYYTGVDDSFAVPASPAGNEIRDAWQSAVNKVLTGATAAAAMATAQKTAQAAYDQANS